MSAPETLSLRAGERHVVGSTEIAVLETAADGRVTLRIGPAGRCERRVTLRPGQSASAGGVTVALGKGMTADRVELLLS